MDLSAEILDHLLNPRNRGVLVAPDGVEEAQPDQIESALKGQTGMA